ncbi:MAG: hypothetical protein MUF34_38290 [Polyangiaceae bacterium]|nr:hypothetical protein [Polyangiaceae bacterium]
MTPKRSEQIGQAIDALERCVRAAMKARRAADAAEHEVDLSRERLLELVKSDEVKP